MSNESKIEKSKNDNSQSSLPGARFWILVSIAIVCGLAAGVLGESLAKIYIFKDFGSSTFSGELNLSGLNAANSGLVIRDAKKVVVNQDVKIAETVAGVRPVLASVFKEIPATSSAAEYYNLEDPLFVGLIVTADGWVAAMAPNDLKNDFKFKNYVVITGDRQIYKIDKLAALKNLPGEPLIFHLAGANNLSVKKNAARSELTLGESLLVINDLTSVRPVTLAALSRNSIVANSDTASVRLKLSSGGDESLKNSFVFDLSGNLVALVAGDETVVPAFSFNSAWSSLSQKNQILPPYLGVNYLDLTRVKTNIVSLDKGAWLYPASASQPAVLKGSPAETAGLKAGDVITWVNNVEIDANNDLADLLANYKAGDKITLTYIRAGAEKEVEIKLGEKK
ncbi:MAG: PDZ domain-containing protein [Patescibacteria group bacterium]|jgi:hypothetical protein